MQMLILSWPVENRLFDIALKLCCWNLVWTNTQLVEALLGLWPWRLSQFLGFPILLFSFPLLALSFYGLRIVPSSGTCSCLALLLCDFHNCFRFPSFNCLSVVDFMTQVYLMQLKKCAHSCPSEDQTYLPTTYVVYL